MVLRKVDRPTAVKADELVFPTRESGLNYTGAVAAVLRSKHLANYAARRLNVLCRTKRGDERFGRSPSSMLRAAVALAVKGVATAFDSWEGASV